MPSFKSQKKKSYIHAIPFFFLLFLLPIPRTSLSIYPADRFSCSKNVWEKLPETSCASGPLFIWWRRPLPKPRVLSGASGLQSRDCLSVSMSACHRARDTTRCHTHAWIKEKGGIWRRAALISRHLSGLKFNVMFSLPVRKGRLVQLWYVDMKTAAWKFILV